MKVESFFKKHPDIKDSAVHYAKAMLLAGSTEKQVLKAINRVSEVTSGTTINLTCPNCKGTMQIVNLTGERRALYCKKDRVTLPLPVN